MNKNFVLIVVVLTMLLVGCKRSYSASTVNLQLQTGAGLAEYCEE